jgi:hypothetical protein
MAHAGAGAQIVKQGGLGGFVGAEGAGVGVLAQVPGGIEASPGGLDGTGGVQQLVDRQGHSGINRRKVARKQALLFYKKVAKNFYLFSVRRRFKIPYPEGAKVFCGAFFQKSDRFLNFSFLF